MGKPIIASDVPGCREVVVDGENGLRVPVRDSIALASALQRMLGSHRLRQDMGAAGRQRMVDRFDEREVISQTIRVYQERPEKSQQTPGHLEPGQQAPQISLTAIR